MKTLGGGELGKFYHHLSKLSEKTQPPNEKFWAGFEKLPTTLPYDQFVEK